MYSDHFHERNSIKYTRFSLDCRALPLSLSIRVRRISVRFFFLAILCLSRRAIEHSLRNEIHEQLSVTLNMQSQANTNRTVRYSRGRLTFVLKGAIELNIEFGKM